MSLQTAGIHHITAFARNPQENIDFYAGVLGLRLVKKTVNFDAPEVYHLYFGDRAGNPGTIITFFPWPNSRRGRIGGGQVGITTYVVPVGALPFWETRLASFGVPVMRAERFQEQYLQFYDNEGLRIELVEREGGANNGWSFGGITPEHAIKGFGGAVLYSTEAEKTASLLQDVLGLTKVGEDVGYWRFRASGEIGNLIDLSSTNVARGVEGAGTVHHIAWRAKDFEEHAQWQQEVLQAGYIPTDLIDRQYFHALYFRERGGILFEIATDPPGFANDEEADALGQKLMLPSWFEGKREEIEKNLLPVEVRELEAYSK
ncbi:ring-cleaving dioxygenase [Paenibacillus mucilaginosus]|uniref:MhqO2 n=1 Tax=Paenibacillus mucilaginosus (strain KNP414) TaxID=1036673 RepID=F8FRM9_PAEMK|nr:ring-cleaving dioxygenase [Paenibacillus mucilaginosus]AEI40586.1 MhqO2 [Paenibacillus mucilaginosus KNP414]MCG7216282.1 ring-cleaving dioxygenase [Paenibacillus mucilaginosus]WDM29740.1 ring-cleaving dioxygenase [Paenibacillus mucilaginosus]